MFDTENNTAKLSAIVRWGKAFSAEKVEEAKKRLLILKKKRYKSRDKKMMALLDYLGTGVLE